MTILDQVNDLTQATTDLLVQIKLEKDQLDDAVSRAETAADRAETADPVQILNNVESSLVMAQGAAAAAQNSYSGAVAAADAVGSYTTLSLATTGMSSQPDNKACYVTADGTNNGFYVKRSGVLTRESTATIPALAALVSANSNNGFLARIITAAGKSLGEWRWDGTFLTKLGIIGGNGIKITTKPDRFIQIDTPINEVQGVNGFLYQINTAGGKNLATWRWDGTLLTKLPLQSGTVSITQTNGQYKFDLEGWNRNAEYPGTNISFRTPSGKSVAEIDTRGVPKGKVQMHTVADVSVSGGISAWISADAYGNLSLKTQDTLGIVRTIPNVSDCTAPQVQSGRVWFYGAYKGECHYWHMAPDGSDIHRIFPQRALACWGDSMTASAGATQQSNQWPVILASLLNCPTYQGGIGGQRSHEIAFRQSGINITCDVAGNLIPSSGSVVVTNLTAPGNVSINPFYPNTDGRDMRVFIGGVDGTLTLTNGTFTFTRWSTGPAVTVTPSTTIIANLQGMEDWIHTIWAGRNDGGNASAILPAVASMIAALRTQIKRYIVIGVLPTTAESIGTSSRTTIDATNAQLNTLYGGYYLNLLPALQAANNGSANDLADVAAGLIPRSLMSDSTHLTDSGYAVVATTVYNFIISKNW